MTKILMICHGNICRSTMAEFVMKEMVRAAGRSATFEIASAGTSREEIGNDTHHGTQAKLRAQGVPFAPRRARQVTKADYAYYDYLVCMDGANVRNLTRIVGEDVDGKVYLLLDFVGLCGESLAQTPSVSNRTAAQAVATRATEPTARRAARDIADPWYTGNFDATYADVVEGCTALLKYCKSPPL